MTMYEDHVTIEGTIIGGMFEAQRAFAYEQRSRDVGLCTMILKLKQDNPSIQTIERIQTTSSVPFDLWSNVTKLLYGDTDIKGHKCLVCGRQTINYHDHEVK